MNKYVKQGIDWEALEKSLSKNLGDEFSSLMISNNEGEEEVIIELDAEYWRHYTPSLVSITVYLTIETTVNDLVNSADPVKDLRQLIMKEYNGEVAKELEKEMENAKAEYENFKC